MPMGELTNRVYGELHFGFHYAAKSSMSAEIRLSVDVSKHVVSGRFVAKCHDVPKSYNTLSHMDFEQVIVAAHHAELHS